MLSSIRLIFGDVLLGLVLNLFFNFFFNVVKCRKGNLVVK